ncbi:questin oxidase family protein [Nocardia blacklockiae]|uniref:questin oxidase family protein n=1 Tax=Nocardia blacklockiae TaxID=480036 RepID=UPI0018931137|nr:questin oxidase family protein [Nocardia blacklockiae]MBF6174774.1 questin oxidase family protein [Nocardia blacklockiae]
MTTKHLDDVSDLLDDRTHHIEFNGHLTNHVKHAVVALAGIGASEQRIRDYYRSYATLTPYGFPLEPRRPATQRVDADNWREFVGRRAHFDAYLTFFDGEVEARGVTGAVARYAPELLTGWVGAFTHAAIHLGWAVWAEHPAMVAEALAYLAFSYVRTVGDERSAGPDFDAADPLESLVRLSGRWSDDTRFRTAVEAIVDDTNTCTELHPELNRSGLQARVAGVARGGLAELSDTPAWIHTLPAAERRERVRRAITLLYLAQPGDFVVLHLITSLFALEVVADTLDSPETTAAIYDLYWAGARIITAAERKFPEAEKLRELDALYAGRDADRTAHALDEFEVTARRAWLEDEEHNPKLVFVLRAWWDASDWAGYRHAAAQFTRTPELPPSFDEPPTE